MERISTWEGLLSLEKTWKDLLDRRQNTDLFLTYEWMANWWKHFGHGNELFVLAMKEDGETIGIAPMMRSREKLKLFPVRRLGFFFNEHSIRSDFIFSEKPKESLRTLVRYWEESSGLWDVIDLAGLCDESNTLPILREVVQESKTLSILTKAPFFSSYILAEKDWESYLQNKSSNFRKNLKTAYKRVSTIGSAQYQCIMSPEDIEAAMYRLFEVELKSWKREGGEIIVGNEELRNYYLSLAKIFAEKGACEVRFVEVNGHPIATTFSVLYKDKGYVIKTSYDEAFASVYPGMLIASFLVQDLWKKGIKEIDFIIANAFHKRWTALSRSYSNTLLFNRRFYSRLLKCLHQAAFPVVKKVRRLRAKLPGE